MPIFIEELPELPELYGQFGSPVLQDEYKCTGRNMPRYWKTESGAWIGFTLAPLPEVKVENTEEEQELIDIWAPRILDVPATVLFRPYGHFKTSGSYSGATRCLSWHKDGEAHWTVEIQRSALSVGTKRDVILALLETHVSMPRNFSRLYDFLTSLP